MSVEFSEADRQEALDCLRLFTRAHPSSFGKDDPLPVRVAQFGLTADEVQGECIDWALEYLRKGHISVAVATLIACEAVKDVLALDLSQEGTLLEASRLARILLNKVLEVCKRWIQAGAPMLRKSKLNYDVSAHAIKNTRRKMEDRHTIIADFNAMFGLSEDHPSQAFFAIFDGHGGLEASVYSSSQVHCRLAKQPNLQTNPKMALKQAFVETDEWFVAKAKREGLRSGSTGVAAFISGSSLCIAWLGDSQVILCKGSELVTLMNPHKPNREDERQRIEDLGGCVVWFGAWRVNGSLSVSRAIGDAEHKPYISGEPDVMEYALEGDEDYIVLACDGLWDVVSPEKAIELINNFIKAGGSRESVASMLVNHAKEEGSNDNISVVVVYLDEHRKVSAGMSNQTALTEEGGTMGDGQQAQERCNFNANVNSDLMTDQPHERLASTPSCNAVHVSDANSCSVDTLTTAKEPSTMNMIDCHKSGKPSRSCSEKGKKLPVGSPKSKQRTPPGHLEVKSRSIRSKSAPEITPIS